MSDRTPRPPPRCIHFAHSCPPDLYLGGELKSTVGGTCGLAAGGSAPRTPRPRPRMRRGAGSTPDGRQLRRATSFCNASAARRLKVHFCPSWARSSTVSGAPRQCAAAAAKWFEFFGPGYRWLPGGAAFGSASGWRTARSASAGGLCALQRLIDADVGAAPHAHTRRR